MANLAPTPRLSQQEREWRAQDDLRTLQAADAIRTDRSRMSAAATHAQKQVAALSRIAKPAAKPAAKDAPARKR
jgi:hypothetical protein